MNKPKTNNIPSVAKRVAVYARVSTQEQTKGQYPSCESQIEELVAFCNARGWQVIEPIKDEAHRAGTLKRPGLTRLRHLVETEQIDGIVCTWYNRLIGSRDFYILDKEFKAHNVSFTTIHDPADRNTAAGRLLESMLVTIKTFENEQVGEKVRTKMRMRAEKGLWNGGYVPFGFQLQPQTQVMLPDPETKSVVRQIFQLYVEKQSDFVVRDWLKAHNIPAPQGKAEWTPSTIRDLLSNRRYIAEIEINKERKGIEDLPEHDAYRIVPAPYEPLVDKETFELAQAIRANRAQLAPNRGGKSKGQGHRASQNQCNRVYLLQGSIVCGICGASMTTHYVYHKPNERDKRKSPGYVFHYTCAQKMKYRQAVNHQNRILARLAENWVLDAIDTFVTEDGTISRAIDIARERSEVVYRPEREALTECQRALQENQQGIDELVETAKNARGALLDILSEKAMTLKLERERLKAEQRVLLEKLAITNYTFDEARFRHTLQNFPHIREYSTPEELQQLLRILVRRVEWMPDRTHLVHYYLDDKVWSDKNNNDRNGSNNWRIGPSERISCESARADRCGLFCFT
jgi:site-specific DNA recombinase